MLELPPPEEDGLIVPEVGEWSHDKHHFLQRYIDAFTTAMRRKRWSGLHYVDLFAGAGIERLQRTRRLEWGSPLIAAQARFPFAGLHLCELDPERCRALSARLDRLAVCSPVQLLNDDANRAVVEVVKRIPARALCLAFLDPYGLHLDHETLRALADRRADLVIFFPDRLDILRNWEAYYWDNPSSNLDRVLGPGSDWRRVRDTTARSRWVTAFRKLYETQIGKLGYTEFECEPIPSTGRRLYWLLFCSRSETGAGIWRGTSLRKPDQQSTFDFGAS